MPRGSHRIWGHRIVSREPVLDVIG